MRIVDTDEIKKIQDSITKIGLEPQMIIENFGVGSARYLHQTILKSSMDVQIIVLLGAGKNACDGLSCARHLANLGYKISAFKLFPNSECSKLLLDEIERAKIYGVSIGEISDVNELADYYNQIDSKTMLIDAIFGTGSSYPMPNFLYEIINFINKYESFSVSIDIPSGVDPNSGDVQGNAICAKLTLVNSVAKQGYFVSDGVHNIGQVQLIESGIPKDLIAIGNKFLLESKDILKSINTRDKFADKKVFGHTLVLGGSHGLTGALVLASSAALKVGAGLVTGATWEPQYNEFISRLTPDIMTGFVPLEVDRWPVLIQGLEKYSAIVIGPGLARSTRTRRLVLEILNNFSGPVVLDADAINVLSLKEDKNVFKLRSAPTVLTPHYGEFAKFAGVDKEIVEKDPIGQLKKLIGAINCTVVLKGPCTFLGLTDGNMYFNYLPNDGMATGGAGDVLAGILGGLLSQDSLINNSRSLSDSYEELNKVVVSGVLIHSLSGLKAADKHGVRSMSASSLIEALPEVFKYIDNELKEI